MKKNTLFLLFVVLVFSCSSNETPPIDETEKDPPRVSQMMYVDVSRLGIPYAKDPHVIRFNGRYLMYYSIPPQPNVADSWWNIGIAESQDLIQWKRIGEIKPAPGAEYEEKGVVAPCALVINNKVHLFYQRSKAGGREDAICHAVSDDGLNFSRNPTNPIFSPTGNWTYGRAIDADVAFFKGKYFLYFATRDKDYRVQMVGVATAPANTNFNREDWTQAVDGPILYPELSWEKTCIEAPSVMVRDNKMYMFYAGAFGNPGPQQIGVAESSDGLNWERMFEEPFMPHGGPGDWNETESGHPHIFVDEDGRTYLFYQGNNDRGITWYISNEEVFWNNGTPYRKNR